jgi:hypothetical protein
MGIGVPRLQRQLVVSAAVIATSLALAPHARADLLPATPVTPTATSAVELVPAAVSDVVNAVPTTVEAAAEPATPAIRPVATVIRQVVEPVRAVTLQSAGRITTLVASTPQTAVRPSAIAHAPAHAARAPHASSPNPASRPHPVAGQPPAPRTGRPATPPTPRRALLVTRHPVAPQSITLRRITIPSFTLLGTGWAAAGSASSAGSPAGLQALALFWRPFALVRLVVPNQAPRSHIQLLSLERPD